MTEPPFWMQSHNPDERHHPGMPTNQTGPTPFDASDYEYDWSPEPPPGTPEYPYDPWKISPRREAYERWTRKPLLAWPVVVHGEFMGVVWASKEHDSAAVLRLLSRPDGWMDVWEARLDEAYRQGLRPTDAVGRWIGAPEDPVGGHIPSDVPPYEAPNLATLYQRINPGGPPAPNPWIQDGEFPDGTPVDRSQGWGPLVSSPLSRYPTDTQSPVRFFPVTKNATVLGYLWASTTGEAADYLPRSAAGAAGVAAAGLWQLWLSRAYKERLSSLQALDRCQNMPEDHLSGVIGGHASLSELPSLDQLKSIARQ
ncbi:hypothetical protein ACQPZ2_03520 [Nocardia pseudovaccinii]|uniref:hypothetical protein n=1 Tax=Nocardia pseudovaccinii TaxID=189540 RepID=UPI003D8EB8E9